MSNKELSIAIKALRNIAPLRQCESFTSGSIGSCFRDGRLLRAKYGNDQACSSCIAYDALDRIAGKKGLRGAAKHKKGQASKHDSF